MLISSSNSSILFGVCLVRLFTPCSFPSGPRFSRVVVFVRCSLLSLGLYSASRSIFLVRVVFVSSSRRVAVVTVVVCPVTCCMVFVGYVVNVARGFFLLACLQCIHFLLFLYCFSCFSANHQLAPFLGASWSYCVCGFSLCVRVDYGSSFLSRVW